MPDNCMLSAHSTTFPGMKIKTYSTKVQPDPVMYSVCLHKSETENFTVIYKNGKYKKKEVAKQLQVQYQVQCFYKSENICKEVYQG